jgi:serine protease SohB
MEFLADYGSFLLKTVSLIIIISIPFLILFSSKGKDSSPSGTLRITNLSDKLDNMAGAVKSLTLNKNEKKKLQKEKKKNLKAKKNKSIPKPVFVLNFIGDIEASSVENLKEEITAILKSETKCQELVLRLESPGGTVIGYGLCAAQLQRLRDAGIRVTACVDKVAASGGYMMACVCNKIVSSPFAIIGSIGVVAAIPNFHKVLKKNNVDYELHTAGEYKRTITMFGETTPAGRKKFKEHLEDIHVLFKDHIKKFRPSLDMKKIATGETWEGIKALEVGLVDEISTSDEYLLNLSKKHEIFEISFITRQNFQDKLSFFISTTITRLISSLETFFDKNKYR